MSYLKLPKLCRLMPLLALGLAPLTALAQLDERFAIQRFEVSGSALFSATDFERLTRPYTGPGKVFGDIQKALDAVEGAYKDAGYTAVQVLVPEQELDRGVVRFQVIETPVGSVTVTGNAEYSTDNIRRSLPGLREGATPNAREISESVQLANENQGKQVEVVLGVGKREGTVDARVDVKEDGIQRWYLNADNTGTRPTGRLRTGISYQHNNLLDRDQTLTLSYTTSPDKPGAVKLDVFSIGYRIPFYALGDSLDLIYGYSNVSTPVVTATLGGSLPIIGKGDVFGLRWNHYFARRGEYSSRLVLGFDWKDLQNCPAGPCTKLLRSPVSATYIGKLDRPKDNLNYSLGIAKNVLLGSQGVRPDAANQLAGISNDDFTIFRASASYSMVLPQEWLLRVAATGQHSLGTPLIAAEQIGLAGNSGVRGFLERAVAADSGAYANLEVYTPEMAPRLGMSRGNLRGLVFLDHGVGRNHVSSRGLPAPNLSTRITSWGLGLRYSLDKSVSLKLDLAQIVEASPQGVYSVGGLDDNNRGDSRAHMSVTVGF